jgi:hypothetical protein
MPNSQGIPARSIGYPRSGIISRHHPKANKPGAHSQGSAYKASPQIYQTTIFLFSLFFLPFTFSLFTEFTIPWG